MSQSAWSSALLKAFARTILIITISKKTDQSQLIIFLSQEEYSTMICQFSYGSKIKIFVRAKGFTKGVSVTT